MTTAEKLLRAKADYDEVYAAGYSKGQSDGGDNGDYYNAFWDAYQQNGTRTDLNNAFAGIGWTDTTYKPPHPMKPTTAENTFLGSAISETEIDIDFSECTTMPYCFRYSSIKRIKLVDCSSMAIGTSALNWAFSSYALEQVALICKEGVQYINTFYYCSALKELTIAGGVISSNINVQWSKDLSHDSLVSIIDHLQDKSGDTSGTQWVVTVGAENYAKLTADDLRNAETKGWDIK